MNLHKKILFDEDQNPVAVQISFEEFQRLEEIIENYGLVKLMEETNEEERLSLSQAKEYYAKLKQEDSVKKSSNWFNNR